MTEPAELSVHDGLIVEVTECAQCGIVAVRREVDLAERLVNLCGRNGLEAAESLDFLRWYEERTADERARATIPVGAEESDHASQE